MLSDDQADRFIEALKRIERERDPSPLVELFDDDAVIDSPAQGRSLAGKAGAHQFWSAYLRAFDRVESNVQQAHEFGDIAILEWQSSAVLRTGKPVDYHGVSVVEFCQDKIKRFCAYFDAATIASAA